MISAPLPDQPVMVSEIELTMPLQPPTAAHPDTGKPYGAARVLVRLATEPLGLVDVVLPTSAECLAATIWREFASDINERLAMTGTPFESALPVGGLKAVREWCWLTERAAILEHAPAASIVMCTRDREDGLAACLESVASLSYPDYEIVLVDNGCGDDRVRRLIDGRVWDVPVRYVRESTPGLSWARNAGARAARGAIVAFIDDDEKPDTHWLAEFARVLSRDADVGVVSGPILARRLDTAAERVFEEIGGHSKGRGFRALVFDQTSHKNQHPLYPLPPFGAGGNMAFRREVLAGIDYFDVAMGAGTPAFGGEDTVALSVAMLAGYSIAWQPSAFVYHTHYSTLEHAARQAYGYGVGITAFYARMIAADPRRLGKLAVLAPRALLDLRANRTAATASIGPAGLASDLQRERLKGMVRGPRAYFASRAVQRAAGRRRAQT